MVKKFSLERWSQKLEYAREVGEFDDALKDCLRAYFVSYLGISLFHLRRQKKALLECNMPDNPKEGLLNFLDFVEDEICPP